MFCGISGLFGGLFVVGVSFNILITASPCGELVDVPCGTVIAFGVLVVFAFGVAFLPLVVVDFLGVVFFGLAMIFSPFFRLCGFFKR
jgi:hypothetical protein